VFSQEYIGKVEVVVVDDGLRPSPPPRAVHVLHTGGVGPAAARNLGCAAASGDYVAFCDDDDRWQPTKLRRQVEALEHDPEAVMAVTGSTVVRSRGRRVRLLGRDTLTRSDLVASRWAAAHTSSFLLRRSVVPHGGPFDASLPHGYGEDWDLLLRLAARGTVRVVDEPLVLVRSHRGSFFAQNWCAIADGLRALVERHPDLLDDRRNAARISAQLALADAALGRRPTARALLATARALAPLAPRTLLVATVVHGHVPARVVSGAVGALGRSI
jgi:glycosyltransferase involved in cell wall biosynthesis